MKFMFHGVPAIRMEWMGKSPSPHLRHEKNLNDLKNEKIWSALYECNIIMQLIYYQASEVMMP